MTSNSFDTLVLTVTDADDSLPISLATLHYATVKQTDVSVLIYRFNVSDPDPDATIVFATTSTDYTVGASTGQVTVTDKSAQALDAKNCPTDDSVVVTATSGSNIVTMTLYVQAIPEDITTQVNLL